MAQLFHRVAAVTVDTLKVTGLRVQFRVVKSNQPEPNTVECVISNLAQSTRKRMQTSGALLTITAGYCVTPDQDTSELLFRGDARTIIHTREGPDWLTKIQAGDGESFFRKSRTDDSYAKGIRKSAVVKALLRNAKLDIKAALAKLDSIPALNEQYTNGLSISAKTQKSLSDVLGSAGYGWSMQDSTLQILARDETSNDPAIVLSPSTGLIESPELGEDGYARVKSLLQPGIRPGRRLILDSRMFKGAFRVEKVVHTGDTHGQPWYSDCEASPL